MAKEKAKKEEKKEVEEKKVEEKKDLSSKVEKKVFEDDDDTIEIKSGVLQQILERQKELDEKLKERDDTIEMLKYTADKGRLQAWQEKNKGKLVKEVALSIYNDQLVVGWKTVKDEVGIRDGKVYATQIIKLVLQDTDGSISETETPHVEWARSSKKIKGEVLREINDTEKGELFVIKFEDYGEVEVPVVFVNPF